MTALGNVCGRYIWWRRAERAGDSTFKHYTEEIEVQRVRYKILGNSTVLYRRSEPYLFGKVAQREFEKWKDLEMKIFIWAESVRSHNFYTLNYVKYLNGDLISIEVGDWEDVSIIVGTNNVWIKMYGCLFLLNFQIVGMVWVLKNFTDPQDPKRQLAQACGSCLVFNNTCWAELEWCAWKSLILSTNALIMPSAVIFPVGSCIWRPFVFNFYVKKHRLHVFIH